MPHRKKISPLLAYMILGMAMRSHAQFGILAGANFSTQTSQTQSFDAKTLLPAVYLGVSDYIELSQRFGLLPQLTYSQQGQSTKMGAFHANYLTLPILAAYHFGRKLEVLLGPEPAYLLTVWETSARFDTAQFFRPFTLAFDLGIRYKVLRQGGFEVKVVKGLMGIDRNAPIESTTGPGGGITNVPDSRNPRMLLFRAGFFYEFE
ncbi:MAG TPA: outer membrane beta-barrel protein [Puia sp.]|nr:outer membrane beta-barrel protein [Puia sp.]